MVDSIIVSASILGIVENIRLVSSSMLKRIDFALAEVKGLKARTHSQ